MDERGAREWLAALPTDLRAQRQIIERLLNLCREQPAARVLARYPVFGLSQVLDFDPADLPDGMERTVAGLDPEELAAAAIASAEILGQVTALAAREYGADPPDALARHVTALLAPGVRVPAPEQR